MNKEILPLNIEKERKGKILPQLITTKSQYTYFIKSKYYPEKFIDNLFSMRGNWKKITDADLPQKHIDFVYLDDLYYLNPKYYSINATLKNTVNDDKRVVTLKNALIANLTKIPEATKFIMPQIEIDLNDMITPNKQTLLSRIKALFTKNKVYIFKPISGMGGVGICVFDNFKLIEEYINKIVRQCSRFWNSKQLPDKQNMRIWVLQEYITNPYLITKNNKKYKFHIRHFYLYQAGKSFYKKIGKMALAELPYVHGKWTDKRIHDTHFHNFDKYLFTSKDTGIAERHINDINAQIDELYKIINSIIKAGCYSESKHCFELFGIDLMVTNDYKVKILEVNHGIGLSNNLTKNKAELFEGIMDLIVDSYFPPSISKTNESIDKFVNIVVSV